jgi:transcriptional regulator with XRE-family HTH domain
MSRLGDMIRNERVSRKLTAKQVAKLSGVSEKYLLEVEGGGRIITDDAARRILKVMGKTGELVADFEATSSGEPARPVPVPRSAERRVAEVITVASTETEAPSTFFDALGGIVRRIPVVDALGREIGARMLPTENGRIEGAPPEKVFYLSCPDTSMRGYRLRPGDLLLTVPAAQAVNGATMVIVELGERKVRRVTKQDGGRALLQWFDAEPQSKVVPEKDVQWLGRVVRCEFPL